MPKPKLKQPTAPAAVYLRISSKDQKTDSQRQSILEWLARNGYDLDQVDWYVDVESGRTMKHPEFDRLQTDIFAGTVKTVVVYKIDRIARRSS
jgi:DNA invertase Pin-like site-specific DNA recombinase